MRRVVGLVLIVLLGACGGGSDAGSTSSPTTTSGTTTVAQTTTVPPATTSLSADTTTSTTATTVATSTTTAPTTTTTFPFDTFLVDSGDRCVIDTAANDSLNVRHGPGVDYQVVGTLAHDATGVFATGVAARDDRDRVWFQVTHPDAAGWVASWFLTPSQCLAAEPGEFCVIDTVCTDWLNVRTGPGTAFRAIGWLPFDAVEVAGTGAHASDLDDRSWTQIRYRDGVGWVASWFLSPAPCSASAGEPCVCSLDPGGVEGFVHRVEAESRYVWIDPIEGYYWEEGWADSEAYPINSDPTVLRLRVRDDVMVYACADLTLDLCWDDPTIHTWYPLSTFADWITEDRAIHQSDFWALRNLSPYVTPERQVAHANNQWWHIQLDNCTITGIEHTYHP